jgi:hypothetical protein
VLWGDWGEDDEIERERESIGIWKRRRRGGSTQDFGERQTDDRPSLPPNPFSHARARGLPSFWAQ